MLVIYEKLDEYLSILRKLAEKDKARIIYLVILRSTTEQGLITSEISIQFMDTMNLVHTHRYADLPNHQMVVPSLFQMFGKEGAEQMKKQYDEKAQAVNKQIVDEYEKIKNVLRDMGFYNFVRAYIQ